ICGEGVFLIPPRETKSTPGLQLFCLPGYPLKFCVVPLSGGMILRFLPCPPLDFFPLGLTVLAACSLRTSSRPRIDVCGFRGSATVQAGNEGHADSMDSVGG